jgi:maltose O-acetyltransferase
MSVSRSVKKPLLALRYTVWGIEAAFAMIVCYLPGEAGTVLRRWYYKRRLGAMGARVVIDVGVQMVGAEHIFIGDDCWIDKFVLLLAGPPHEGQRVIARRANDAFRYREGQLVIGDKCHIASHAVVNAHGGVEIGNASGIAAGGKILSLSHHYRNTSDAADVFPYRFGPMVPESEQSLISGPVVIEANAALGTNSVVLPGSTIGTESWVGALSVVSGPIAPYCIATGCPARAVKLKPGHEATTL